MKKTLLLSAVCLLLALQHAMAYNTTTKLQLRAYNNSPISVMIDGTQYGVYSNGQTIENLAPGRHNMQVMAMMANPRNGNMRSLQIFNGAFSISQNRMMEAVISPDNKLDIISDVAMYQPIQATPMLVFPNGYTTSTNATTNHPNSPAYQPGPIAMCDQEFNELLCSINSKSFESTKLQIVRQVLANNYFTSYQIRDLMGAFNFESSRLEVAKVSYSHVVDPNRYYVVNDAFTFESSIGILNSYLQNCHQGIAYR